MNRRLAPALFAAAIAAAPAAPAATFTVGPTRLYTSFDDLFAEEDLGPGDVVEVDYSPTPYANVLMGPEHGGAPGNPVTIRGIASNGERPLIRENGSRAGRNGIEFQANHVVFENFDVTGSGTPANGTARCVYHHAHDVTLRRVRVYDCPRQGVLGADQGSGSLTIEYSEIRNAGSLGGNHAIYMATDEVAYPGAVFRLQHSVVSDSRFADALEGGNLIKSRAERNEIYYNRLEGAYYHELELIGPDPNGAADAWTPALAREDSDVVGNLVIHTSTAGGNVVRIGGDGTGASNGRYRFVNNTFVVVDGPMTTAVFRTHYGLESVAMHNNVLARTGPGTLRVMREESPTQWLRGRLVAGSRNFVETGATFLPVEWADTLSGNDPVWESGYRPEPMSPLVGAGGTPVATADFVIAAPEFPPRYEPAGVPTVATARPVSATPTVGAFEPDLGQVFANGFE